MYKRQVVVCVAKKISSRYEGKESAYTDICVAGGVTFKHTSNDQDNSKLLFTNGSDVI